MSVPEGKRRESRLEVFVKAQQLATYTIQITANRNTFPPEYDERITNDLVKTARDIYAKAWEANLANGNTDWKTRDSLQKEAIRLCGQLFVYIGIAKGVFHLRSKRIQYWATLVSETKKLLIGWHENDRKRFSA